MRCRQNFPGGVDKNRQLMILFRRFFCPNYTKKERVGW